MAEKYLSNVEIKTLELLVTENVVEDDVTTSTPYTMKCRLNNGRYEVEKWTRTVTPVQVGQTHIISKDGIIDNEQGYKERKSEFLEDFLFVKFYNILFNYYLITYRFKDMSNMTPEQILSIPADRFVIKSLQPVPPEEEVIEL